MHWMYQSTNYGLPEMLGLGMFPSVFSFLPLLIWALVWKGWALWLAARRGESMWFVALLIINTMGLLKIFYIFAIAKQADSLSAKTKETESPTKASEGDVTE